MNIKSLLLSNYDRLVCLKRDLYDYFTRKEVLVSVGDLIQDRGILDGTLLIVASRLLDIESYFNRHDETFWWQKKMSDIVDYNDEEWRAIFKSIIRSYQEKGYNGKSHFLLDRNRMLKNGTHRIALHLYYKIYTAKVYAVNREYPFFDALYERFRKNLQPGYFIALENKLEQIRQQLISDGVSFCAVIPRDVSLGKLFYSIKSSIHVKWELRLCKLSEEVSDSLKLNANIEYKLVLFTLDDPQYELIFGLLESQKIKHAGIPEGCYVSRSCYEGKNAYDLLTPYFID